MKKDTEVTDMIFRVDTAKEYKDNVFALFPHEVCTRKGDVTTYQHIGQHSSGDYKACISQSRPATEQEYKDLKAELDSIGYNINIVKKQNYKKYLISYRKR